MRMRFYCLSVIGIIASLALTVYWLPGAFFLIIILALVGLGLFDISQKEHSIWRNFPVLGHGRWIMESLRPMMYQYFVESETDGVPINRMFRTVIYQRAKGVRDTVPFGTKMDTYEPGYEWMDHSLGAIKLEDHGVAPRVRVGTSACGQPYDLSLFNVSAMSFGALSTHAVMALNKGAGIGDFAQNTGEGGLSPYHLQHGGDLIWQIGTGYFGCRDEAGNFSPQAFKEKAGHDSVKMIEIKLSQGAKPGHGGILPAIKNTSEIAEIRGVKAGTQVDSPPTHTAFSNPLEMMEFISELRDLCGAKPVGFKLCVGRKSEFVGLCKAMIETGIKPDFITIDGGEGGTGAAPLEYTNAVGAPLRDGLAFAVDCLKGFGLRDDIKVLASGKVFTGFHVVRLMAIRADACLSARGMMLALGCIQSLSCNNNKCPTGITTQDRALVSGLDVDEKAVRVANFHSSLVHSVMELLAAGGLHHPKDLKRVHINRRVSAEKVMRYDEIYPMLEDKALLRQPYPTDYEALMEADPMFFK